MFGVPLQNFYEIFAFFGCDGGNARHPEAVDLLLRQGAHVPDPIFKTIRAIPAGLFTHRLDTCAYYAARRGAGRVREDRAPQTEQLTLDY